MVPQQPQLTIQYLTGKIPNKEKTTFQLNNSPKWKSKM